MALTLTPEQAAYLNLEFGPIGKVVVFNKGNPSPGLAVALENPNGISLDVGHFLAIPTPDGQVSFAVTLDPDVRSDLSESEVVIEIETPELGALETTSAVGAGEPMTERPIARLWTLSILCNTVGTSRPVPFALVYFANRAGVEFALGMNRIPTHLRIPIGVVVNGDRQTHPVYLHAEYLLGPQGVHANWGGLSGLSGKTSKKSLCELAILTQRQTMGLRCALIVFATKGSDELFRDLPSHPEHPFWRAHPELQARINASAFLTVQDPSGFSDLQLYEALNLHPIPFEDVRLYVPCGDGQWWGYRTPETNRGLGTTAIFGFQWSLRQVAPYMSLFASTDADDKLRAMEIEVLRVLNEGYWLEGDGKPHKQSIHTLADLEAFFTYATDNVDGRRRWKGHHIETIARARARYLSIFQRASQVVSAGVVSADQGLPLTDLRDGMVWVIDLSRLKDESKLLVLYKVITELYDAMQANRLPLDRLLLDIDELNQHAPRRQSGALTRTLTAKLQDISERARTDGVILLTAQQTLSEVDERVEANVATRFYGMMGMQESQHFIYSLSRLEQYVIGKLEPGEMLVQHPILRHRVKVRVPRPSFLRGKEGQALLRSTTPADPVEHVLRLMAGGRGRVLPKPEQVRPIVEAVLTAGATLSDVEQAARQVGQVAPLEGPRNTEQATLKLFQKVLTQLLGKSFL